ncbi:aldehyde dehydrogenase family protein [Brevibacillus dissolubilis]|uniref:aldehyde dehydrogenase family protein n=1 Tax=Brevibacillus dissolubilis TaxID=1844116 RepID=UPI00111765E6|nr:aldehyde dehydrogenase family protein [Brevibacillus dissolubilis]
MGMIEILNPATGEVIGEVQEKTSEEITAAMKRAREAFPAWRDMPLEQRLGYVARVREYLVEHMETLAQKIVQDTGKVLLEAMMTEIFTTADFMKHYEKHAAGILAPKKVGTPIVLFGRRSEIQYRPMGVVAVISPWNYPLQLAMVPAISALIAGNTVLLKPSEVTPLTGLIMEEILNAGGFPEGVVQVLHGGKEVGQTLVDAKPDKIFFTGSVATGKKIMAQAAQHLIPVELELGGKDPMIVFADADLERAANAAVWGAFTNAGQTCMAVERVYVESSIFDRFVGIVKAKTEQLRVGTGEEADMGSMTFPHQLSIVEEHLADAVAKGATILTGGKRLNEKTLHFPPTLLTNVDHTMKIMNDETFGPVLPIMPFRDESEALRLANDSPFGLNSSVWSRDTTKARRVAGKIESGNVCINDVIVSVANPHLPFGGIKESGMGRYHGEEGLITFCHVTSIIESPGKKASEINWYPYTPKKREAFQTLMQFYGKQIKASVGGVNNLLREFFK